MKKAITIQDIANSLGISRNTVSKVLNGAYVPEKTKRLVLEKAKELNYKSMSNMSSEPGYKRKYRLLLLSGKPLNNINFFIPIIRGVENYCYDKNYELLQYIYNKDISSFDSFTSYLQGLNIDGIIAMETFDKDFINNLTKQKFPIVFIDFCAYKSSHTGNYDIIETSNREPIYQITRILHKKYNFTRFSFVGDYTHCLSFHNRYVGMLQALLINNVKHSKNYDILKSDKFDYGNPILISEEIKKINTIPECFICCNDFIARNVCKALQELNLRVPEDVFVVGYDDAIDSTSCHPTITTIGMDKEFLGSESVRSLIYRIENPNIPTREISIDSKILPRESTKRDHNN